LPQRRRSWPDLRIIHAERQAVGDVISVKLFAVLHHLVGVGITASAGDDEPNCRDANGGDGNACSAAVSSRNTYITNYKVS
jgi:hypothetical protein